MKKKALSIYFYSNAFFLEINPEKAYNNCEVIKMENRIAPRSRIDKRVFVEIDKERKQPFYLRDGNIFDADSADVSSTGISVRSRYYLPKGLVVDLKIEGTDFGISEVINLEGEVRYCKQDEPSKYRCGLKFRNTRQRYEDIFANLANQ